MPDESNNGDKISRYDKYKRLPKKMKVTHESFFGHEFKFLFLHNSFHNNDIDFLKPVNLHTVELKKLCTIHRAYGVNLP